MLCCAVAYLVKSDTLVHLLMEAFAGSAVSRMEGRVVAVCASSASYLSVSVRTGEAGVKHNLLQPFSILSLEKADERIISLPFRETIFLKIL